jgi:hypothetical protein
MAQATFYCSYGSDRNAALSGDPDDLSIRRLTALLTSLLDEPRAPSLPDWTYRTWCLALQYRELNPRAQASTKELASRRDQALSHPEVRQLVEWAGSRRRDNPAVGAAAALTTVRLAQRRSRFGSLDVAELGRRVAAEADAARPVRFSPSPLPSQRARVILPYSDWDAAAEEEPTRRENPRLASTVGELLALAGADSNSSLSAIEAAVIQAGDWWARHALPVPTSVDGPRLPGVIPAEQLESLTGSQFRYPTGRCSVWWQVPIPVAVGGARWHGGEDSRFGSPLDWRRRMRRANPRPRPSAGGAPSSLFWRSGQRTCPRPPATAT